MKGNVRYKCFLFALLALLFLLFGMGYGFYHKTDAATKTVDIGPVETERISTPSQTQPPPTVTKPTIVEIPNPSGTVEFQSQLETTRKLIEVNLYHDQEHSQTFYAFEENQLVMSGLVSGAITDIEMPPGNHPDNSHNHLGSFLVTKRFEHHISGVYGTPMDYCLFYHGGHAIHACLPEEIDQLGHPASHGCIRLSPSDAQLVFEWAGDDPVLLIIKKERSL